VDMPVFFYIDPEFANDPATFKINEITLSYTFFDAKHAGTQKMLSAVEVSNILFRPLLEREIQNYIRAYPVKNFAGAFEDDAVLKFADRVSGSPNIGTAMPVSRLTLMLREIGVEI